MKTTFLKKAKNFSEKHSVQILLLLAIIVQSVIYIIIGAEKSYFHMDEAYSFGLSNYSQVEIHDNTDFYNTWHDGEYYADYLEVNDDERFDFRPVYENQKNDVHPPFYYLLLRSVMEFSPNQITKWGGIILNILIYAFITIFLFLIGKKLFQNTPRPELLSLAVAFASSLTLASLTSVVYIRMYALATLNVAIITYLHLRLLENYGRKNLILIGLSALIGSLTHYHFLFYLFVLFVMTIIYRARRHEKIKGYIFAILIAAVLSLLIFPFSINHLFFGYRGQGALSSLFSLNGLTHIGEFLGILQVYTFNGMLVPLVIFIALALILTRKKLKLPCAFWFAFCPTIFYFLIVAGSSPYIEVRYIMPICGIIFVLTFYLVYLIFEKISPRSVLKMFLPLLCFTLILPFFTRTEPQNLYREHREIVVKLQDELNLPTVYWFNSSQDRFLDDIYLFSELDRSFIAKDLAVTEENARKIVENEDTSRGMIVFINYGQDNDQILETLMTAAGLSRVEYLKRMNACDIYLLSN